MQSPFKKIHQPLLMNNDSQGVLVMKNRVVKAKNLLAFRIWLEKLGYSVKIVSEKGFSIIGTFESVAAANAHIEAYKPIFEEEMKKRGDIDLSKITYVVEAVPHTVNDFVIFLRQEALSKVLPIKQVNDLVFDR